MCVCSYLVILERTGSSGTLGAYPALYIIYPIIQNVKIIAQLN